ncbi:MAG: hypothetical protein LBN29_05245 [Mediterranea sp.]|jgi:hypothetical protein|nr:hypothetical protein [Mediterranea sp.]
MSTASLAAMQNDLIRDILATKDASVLKRVKEALDTKKPTTSRTKEEALADFDEACKELKLNLKGDLDFKPAEELLNEL